MSKLLIVAMNYAPELTGCGKYTGELAVAMAARGHSVEVVTSPPHYPGWQIQAPYANRYSSETLDGVKVWRCPMVLRAAMGGIWRLIAPVSIALSSGPVILWRMFANRPDSALLVEPTLLAAPFLLVAARLLGVRTVLHVQDLEVDAAFAIGHLKSAGWLKSLAFWFERVCLKGFSHIITISYKMAEQIEAKGIAQGKMSIVRNWVDLDHIKPEAVSLACRDELGIPHDAFVVLYSGNLGPKQGLDVVVDAARLLKDVPGLLFVIAGEGPSKPDLMARSADLANVVFRPFQPYARFSEFLGICNLHVLPQQASAGDLVLPSKLGGMLASGRPMVVCAGEGTELAVFLDGSAAVVPPEDAAMLAEAIGRSMTLDDTQARAQRLHLVKSMSDKNVLDDIGRVIFNV